MYIIGYGKVIVVKGLINYSNREYVKIRFSNGCSYLCYNIVGCNNFWCIVDRG